MHREQQTQAEPADPFHSGGSISGSAAAPAQEDCAIRGICNGPSVAIASLFPLPAVLADPPQAAGDPGVSSLTIPSVHQAKIPGSPDIPPPRA